MNAPSPDDVQKLRKAYERFLEGRASERDSCAEPEAILELAQGEGPESQRLEILGHVMGCGECRREFELLRALQTAQTPATSWFRPWMAAAASVVLLAGVGYGVWQSVAGEGPVYRGLETGLELVRPAPGVLASGDLQFVWKAEVDAFEYVFEIMDSEGEVALRRTTGDTVVALSSEEVSGLAGPVTWWVRARLEDGTETASSPRLLTLR